MTSFSAGLTLLLSCDN